MQPQDVTALDAIGLARWAQWGPILQVGGQDVYRHVGTTRHQATVSQKTGRLRSVADTEGRPGGPWPPLEAHVPTLPLQKSVESKAGKRDFKNT